MAEVHVNLMQIIADAQQSASRAYRRKVIFVGLVIGLRQMLDAIGLRQESTPVEGIDIKFLGRRLVPANEMPGQPNARNREP